MRLADIDLLLVDDHAPMRALVRSLLLAAGAQRVREASEGHEALDAMALRPADLVLVDHRMPGMSGMELVRRLRTHPVAQIARCRIVMVTGFGDKSHVFGARDAGVDEFLVKPITTQALLQRIDTAMTKRRDFVQAETFQGPDRRRRATGAVEGGRRTGDKLDDVI
jgi:two-component system chemotaxis response regulator CheY